MGLTDEERDRLADVVRLQPTKNAELGESWGMDDGSEVHGYLEDHLGEYYYRDDDSYIRATAEAAELVDVEPGVEVDEDGTSIVRVAELEAQVFEVVAGPDERSQSVVSTLHDLRDEHGVDPPVEDVRSALQALRRKGVVAIEYRTVPTFRRATDADDVTVEAAADEPSRTEAAETDGPGDATADSRAHRGVIEEIESEFERDHAR